MLKEKQEKITQNTNDLFGILPVNKPSGKTSFSLIATLRRILHIKKIGHAGTLDPFAEGVMLLLIGREYTKRSSTFLEKEKEYLATLHLGIETDTYDLDGKIQEENQSIPILSEIERIIPNFQGTIEQIPPMYSAKKVRGKKLYELARKGITIERKPITVKTNIELISYKYPHLVLKIACSKGTYIRSLAHDIGKALGCGGHLSSLTRTISSPFCLEDCFDGKKLFENTIKAEELKPYLRQ